jgi:fused signal recognition particle receptor
MSIFNYRQQPGYFSRLKNALKSTKEGITQQINALAGSPQSPITEEQLEDLEEALISCDIGVDTSLAIIDEIRSLTEGEKFVTRAHVRRLIRARLLDILGSRENDEISKMTGSPLVILVVGVNGVGKTTTIGKLASSFQKQGKKVILSAADTFRAAAVDQLDIWARRTYSEIVKQKPGADPAAVVFDSIAAAKSRSADVVIIDTAGRLHTKNNLMKELEKIGRISQREVEGAPHEVFLILDATTGQNGLVQAREFLKSTGVTGVIVTKLDGTAKGGIVVAIAKELQVPVRYIGIGERVDDFLPFDPESFVDSLVGTEN